ncbi:MAG TPA: M23 family metallopeptidase [Gemmatirosa sp.]|nr:M23 family metallopeptidase [Gemmatirosa sp.]
MTPLHSAIVSRTPLAPIPAVPATPAPPATPAGPAPSRAKPRPARRPGWTFIAVAPTLDARVRRYELRRWHLRTAATLLVGAVAGAFVGGLALGSAGDDEELERAYGLLTEADASLAAVGDTVRALRIAATLPTAASAVAGASGIAKGPNPDGAVARVLARPALPVEGRISSAFARSRLHPILGIWRSHAGMDIAAPSGTPVRAPASGRVVRVERHFGYGLVVEVSHGRDVRTWYAHLRSARVHVGERVPAGAIIATVGASGLASGPHLHYEVRVKGRRVDPARHAF